MTQSIPKPELPRPRRRSSIGQAAIVNGGDVPPASDDATIKQEPDQAVSNHHGGSTADTPEPTTPPHPETTGGRRRATGASNGHATTRPRNRASAVRSATTPASEVAKKRPGGSADILLSIPEELKERMVNTITWSQPHTGIAHQQKFIRKAITDLCERYEREFNSGQAFPQRAVLEPE